MGIADGDTLTILDTSNQQHRIRLYGIDAPEKKQPFGSRSKQNLAALAFAKHAVVEWTKPDRYGRIIGKVIVDGQDVGLRQIEAGLAWWYRKYVPRAESAGSGRPTHVQRKRRGLLVLGYGKILRRCRRGNTGTPRWRRKGWISFADCPVP